MVTFLLGYCAGALSMCALGLWLHHREQATRARMAQWLKDASEARARLDALIATQILADAVKRVPDPPTRKDIH